MAIVRTTIIPVMFGIFLWNTAAIKGSKNESVLPKEWGSFCSTEDRFVRWNFTTLSSEVINSMLQISCHVTDGSVLRFTEIRKWTSTLYPVRKVALNVTCSDNARFHAPWPMKAKNLIYFHTSGCNMMGFFDEYFGTNVTETPDEIRVMEIDNCNITMTLELLLRLVNSTAEVKPDVECGPLTTEKLVLRGIQMELAALEEPDSESIGDLGFQPPDDFGKDIFELFDNNVSNETTVWPEEPLSDNEVDDFLSQILKTDTTSTDQDIDCLDLLSLLTLFYISNNESVSIQRFQNCIDFLFLKLNDDLYNYEHKCYYNSLRHLDESETSGLVYLHVQQRQVNSFYKELRVYNLSRVEYKEVPKELLAWREYTIFPKLEILDLSHNSLSRIPFFLDTNDNNPNGTIDLRHNNITVFSRDALEHILNDLPTAFIRLEGNPINCSCKVVDEFYMFLKENSDLGPYDYLRTMKCFSPPELFGIEVSRLSPSQGKCEEDFPQYLLPLSVTLGSCVLILILIIVGVVCLRKEITILFYTRLNVIIGCGKNQTVKGKKHDVFLSTCDEDRVWLLQNLLPVLRNSKANLKLCLREDWEYGVPIADNAIASVENSAYTLAVVSHNYVANEWCQFEASIAVHQSLVERRRHLVLVFMDDIDKSQLPADVRKYAEICPCIHFVKRLFRDRVLYAVSCRKKISIAENELHGLDQTPITPPSMS